MKTHVVDLYVLSNKKWHAKIAMKGIEETKNGNLETDIYSMIVCSSTIYLRKKLKIAEMATQRKLLSLNLEQLCY